MPEKGHKMGDCIKPGEKKLIIYFKRNIHNYKCDINFENQISISDYLCTKENNSKFKVNYILKACIYIDKKKYFSIICINNNWYKYLNDKIEILHNPENQLYEYEPQILLYELNETNNIKEANLFQNINDPNNIIKESINRKNQIKAFELYDQQNKKIFNIINTTIKENLNQNEIKIFNPFFININFYIISKKGIDNIISIQTSYDDNIKEIINKFFSKLNQSNESIKGFLLKDQIIDINSKIKLRKLNIKNNMTIIAIKNDKY